MVTEVSGVAVDPSTGGNGLPLSHALPTPENGWPLRPFQIVSLADMLKFEASEFFGIINRLIGVRKDLEKTERPPLTPKEEVDMETHMNRADFICAKYDIDVSYYTDRVREKINNPNRYTFTLASAVNDVKNCIIRDLRNRKFMYIPSADSHYYDQAELFGENVADKFPTANKEVTSAGNCYATGNYTACVFHLMRAVELGARCMVKRLKVQAHLSGVPVELCEWGVIAGALQKGVDNLSSGSRTDKRKKEKHEFYSHALAVFRNFKDAWRNNVSHTRTTYMPGVTKDIMDNTRQFMQHLASRLRE